MSFKKRVTSSLAQHFGSHKPTKALMDNSAMSEAHTGENTTGQTNQDARDGNKTYLPFSYSPRS